MNKHIHKLAHGAGEYTDFEYGICTDEFLEKFAELMVEEFQTLIKDTYLNTAPEHRDCLLVLDAKVEEHFRIKE